MYKDPAEYQNFKFDATFKLICIGDSGVGKSCIIRGMGGNAFNEEHQVTIGAEYTTVAAKINNTHYAKLWMWDNCGQERYNSVTRIYYRDSKLVILVYDITS